MITQEELKNLLHYDPLTGVFTWLNSSRKGFNGKVAGSLRNDGYWAIKIKGKSEYAQRVAWLYMMGNWPTSTVDHKDLNKLNNRWLNLRIASQQEQCCNRGVAKNNTSGHKGVHWEAKRNRWLAYSYHKGKRHFFGYHKQKEDAVTAAENGRQALHKEFFV